MGILGWIFPSMASDDEKLAKARRLIGEREFNEARWTLDGLNHPDAAALRAEAMNGLVELNLEAAVSAEALGDRDLAAEHLDLAREFGATPEQMRSYRRMSRAAAPPPAPKPKEKPAPEPPAPEGDDPIWSLPPDDPRLRYAQLVEAWPEALQPRLLALGAEFASAALAIDEGGASMAWEALSPYTSVDPVAHYERARAALVMGQAGLAAGELKRFGETVGHTRIGAVHTAALLGQLLLQRGQAGPAFDVLNAAVQQSPEDVDLRFTRAGALAQQGRWEEVEADTTLVLRKSSRAMAAWRLLAQARVARHNRPGAVAALETALTTCCSSPGKCGNQPLDIEAARMLARLYAEAGEQPSRVSELLNDIRAAQGGLGPEDEDIAKMSGSILVPA